MTIQDINQTMNMEGIVHMNKRRPGEAEVIDLPPGDPINKLPEAKEDGLQEIVEVPTSLKKGGQTGTEKLP